MEKTINMLRKIFRIFRRIIIILFGWIKAFRPARLSSYYPELKRKPFIIRYFENIKWIIMYGEVNSFYTLYGLDVYGGGQADEYMDYIHFANQRDDANKTNTLYSQIAILRDKLLFSYFAKACNINSPEVIGVLTNGGLTYKGIAATDWEILKDKEDYFCKSSTGECASFVVRIKGYSDLCARKSLLNQGNYILQKRVVQHDEMNRLNPNAINTVRIVTAIKDNKPYVFSSLLRVGTSQSGDVDNWAKGGLAIGINEDGSLKKYGYYKPAYAIHNNPKEVSHPDSGIVFSDFIIPYYNEIIELVLRAHQFITCIQTIGWDVAVTPNGPLIIEGNDNWELSLMQGCNGGLRNSWYSLQK